MMNKNNYTPQPIDTSDVELPKELEGIWKSLDHSPKTVEEIQKGMEAPLPIQEITVHVMELVLAGKVKQVSPGHFCRK